MSKSKGKNIQAAAGEVTAKVIGKRKRKVTEEEIEEFDRLHEKWMDLMFDMYHG